MTQYCHLRIVCSVFIKHFDDFDEETLAPFLRVFEAKRGGTGS